MNQLEPSIRKKFPATIVDARPIVTMTAPYHAKGDLITAVHRQARSGDIRPLQARPSYNADRGLWEMPVIRLRSEAPAWIRPAAITLGIVSLLGCLAGLGWWMVSSLAAAPLAMFLLGALFALVVIFRMGRTPTVNVTQNVTVRR